MKTYICLFLSITVLSTATALGSPILNYTETDLGGGNFDVVFTAVNTFDPTTQAGFDLYDIVFNFPAQGFLISLPSGWALNPSPPGTTIEAFSRFPGAPPLGTDVAPGESLGGFEFFFQTPIDKIPFTFTINNPGQPGQPVIVSGTSTPVSSAVPEPSTLILIALAIAVPSSHRCFVKRVREQRKPAFEINQRIKQSKRVF